MPPWRVEIFWNVCSVDRDNKVDPPPRPWKVRTQRNLPGTCVEKKMVEVQGPTGFRPWPEKMRKKRKIKKKRMENPGRD